jgi:hypothetical protein
MTTQQAREVLARLFDASRRGIPNPVAVVLASRFPEAKRFHLLLEGTELNPPPQSRSDTGEQAVVLVKDRSWVVTSLQNFGGSKGKQVANQLAANRSGVFQFLFLLNNVRVEMQEILVPTTYSVDGEALCRTSPSQPVTVQEESSQNGITASPDESYYRRLLITLILAAPGILVLPEVRLPSHMVRTRVDDGFLRALLRDQFANRPSHCIRSPNNRPQSQSRQSATL